MRSGFEFLAGGDVDDAGACGGHSRRVGLATVIIGAVAVETLVLAFNRWTCPLTGIAARYTAERPDNFAIYLPLWLARYNKHIFGTLYLIGIVGTALAALRPAAA